MTIESTSDIISYLEEKLFTHDIFKMSLKDAIISTVSFVQSEYSIVEKNNNVFPPVYVSEKLRNSQDILKYSLYHIYSNSQLKNSFGRKLKGFDKNLYSLYKYFSIIHDLIMGAKIKKFDVDIDNKRKTILFNPTRDAIIDGKRNHEILSKRIQREVQATNNFGFQDRLNIRKSFYSFFSRIKVDGKSKELKFQLEDNIVKTAYDTILKLEPNYLIGPNFPEDFNFGVFSSQDFNNFWRYLRAFSLIQDLAYKNKSESLNIINKKSSFLIIKKKDFIKQMKYYSKLKESIIKEIYRDLLYDPINISWTEPQYQPIIEIDNESLLLIPLVILSNNYERNYSVLLEKLPWRKNERIKLKESREDSMLNRIKLQLKNFGLKSRGKVKLKEGKTQVSDIDLVIWNEDQHSIFLISLKWFYGPDSVQEVINHSIRYRETNDQQRKIIDYTKENIEGIKTKCGMKFPNQNKLKIYPIIIYEQDMPLNRERKRDLPAVTIERFLKILIQKRGNLESIFRKIQTEYNVYPAIEIQLHHTEITIGEYKFLIPYNT